MLIMDMNMPKTCANCICSYQWYNGGNFEDKKIVCKKDLEKHTPGDDKCPIKGVIDEYKFEELVKILQRIAHE